MLHVRVLCLPPLHCAQPFSWTLAGHFTNVIVTVDVNLSFTYRFVPHADQSAATTAGTASAASLGALLYPALVLFGGVALLGVVLLAWSSRTTRCCRFIWHHRGVAGSEQRGLFDRSGGEAEQMELES